jgi:hypothetical protein
MSDNKLTETINTVRCTERMKKRAQNAKENGYGSETKYVREMWLAGESVIGDLDPRVEGNAAEHNSEIDSAKTAAKALDDGVLLSKLSEEPQDYAEVLESITQEFENVLADQLLELARDDQSAVETDGKGNYYLNQ